MRRILKWAGILLGGLLLLVLGFVLYINFSPLATYENKAPDLKIQADSAMLAEGARIVQMHCAQCHRSKDGKLGGNLMEDGALGTVYAPNITQHPEHGITNYTDGQLAYLLRTGIKADGGYAPPWMTKFPHLSDRDLESIIAFLRSDHPMVQPSNNIPPPTEYSFLAKMLLKMGAFGPLPYPEKPIAAPNSSDQVAYGKYLATAKYECYGCHSANFEKVDMLAPEKSEGFFGGGNPMLDLEGNLVSSANLTQDTETGIGTWTKEQFSKALRTGVKPDGTIVKYPMSPYTLLTEEEAAAIWEYLKTVPVIKNETLKAEG